MLETGYVHPSLLVELGLGTLFFIVILRVLTISRNGAEAAIFLKPICEKLKHTSDMIDNYLSGRSYARESIRKHLLETVRVAVSETANKLWTSFATNEQRQLLKKLIDFIVNSNDMVVKSNKVFVETELINYKVLFETVEKNPLTLAQRLSCIISEDNNLVLAGAGTGKTSTMIGRAGYLIKSRQARPDQLLMLAFAKKAANEMQERLEKRLKQFLGDSAPTIKTFHALGLEIIGKVEGRRPDLSPMAEDKNKFERFIDAELTKQCDVPEFRKQIIRYFGSEKFSYRSPFDFKSMNDYNEYVRTNDIRTLKGDLVKSFEECVISNLLNAWNVEYIYEHPYKINTSGPDFRQYKPDFYITNHDIYIEHFALNEKGQPPQHFDQKRYLDGVKWKRELHNNNNSKLIETYSYMKRAGTLESTLKKALTDAGVVMSSKSDEELLDELRAATEVSEFSKLTSDFIALYKQSNHSFETLNQKAAQHEDASRLLLLFALFAPILKGYEAELASRGQIDFADMIKKATKYVESNQYASPYTHVLVDEFQDISEARARLILALIRQRKESISFVVGDDWQAIYRFAGSDIAFTRDFEKFFGTTHTTTLDLTFRFNDKIGSVASQFVLKNQKQIQKIITSVNQTHLPAISLVRVIRSEDGLHMALRAIVLKAKNTNIKNPTVLVLARYGFVFKDLMSDSDDKFKILYPSLAVNFMTIHAAKGKEADFVIVLGMSRGTSGFPCEKSTDMIIDFLLPEMEDFLHAEERRLFYVAITRSKHRAYLVYNPADASQFILELRDTNNKYCVTENEFDGLDIASMFAHVPCYRCKTGYLVPYASQYGTYIACNNFPRCKYREPPCPLCGGIMKRSESLRTCTTPMCSATMPTCPKCDAIMVERDGKHGKFWGCINYRSDSEFVCTYTQNILAGSDSATA